jgi:hypothetical protein
MENKEKQIVINLGERLEIQSKDLTIADIIKGMALFAATIKEVQKNNPNIKYEDVIALVNKLSDDIVNANVEETKQEAPVNKE